MTKVIKENDEYLIFTTFTRDLDILVQTEPTAYIKVATEFNTDEDANYYIGLANQSGLDTSNYVIVDKDEVLKAKEAARENDETEKYKQFWNSLSNEAKRVELYQMKPEKVNEFLAKVGDTSGITPFTEDEYKDYRIGKLEEKLGITFTEEQKEILKTKEV